MDKGCKQKVHFGLVAIISPSSATGFFHSPPTRHFPPEKLASLSSWTRRFCGVQASRWVLLLAIGGAVRNAWMVCVDSRSCSRRRVHGRRRPESSAERYGVGWCYMMHWERSRKKSADLTSLYHFESQTWVWEAIARTGFSATNEMTLFTRW